MEARVVKATIPVTECSGKFGIDCMPENKFKSKLDRN